MKVILSLISRNNGCNGISGTRMIFCQMVSLLPTSNCGTVNKSLKLLKMWGKMVVMNNVIVTTAKKLVGLVIIAFHPPWLIINWAKRMESFTKSKYCENGANESWTTEIKPFSFLSPGFSSFLNLSFKVCIQFFNFEGWLLSFKTVAKVKGSKQSYKIDKWPFSNEWRHQSGKTYLHTTNCLTCAIMVIDFIFQQLGTNFSSFIIACAIFMKIGYFCS